jgi:hypothetical protein
MSNGVEAGIRHSARNRFAAGAKHFILSLVLITIASVSEASSVVINTDSSWLAKNSAPGTGWNTNAAFDTAADGGWQAAQNNASPPCSIDGCMIWWDGQFSATQQVWLRRTFVLTQPVGTAFIQGGVDDDATIWVNGNIIYNVFDGNAGGFGPINIAPFLVQGNNLIAAFAVDNFAFGHNHQFTARLTINTIDPVPVMPLSLSVLMGLLVLAFGIHQLRGRVA